MLIVNYIDNNFSNSLLPISIIPLDSIRENPIHCNIYCEFNAESNREDEALVKSILTLNTTVLIVKETWLNKQRTSDKYTLLTGYRQFKALQEAKKRGAKIDAVYAYILKQDIDNLTSNFVSYLDLEFITMHDRLNHTPCEQELYMQYLHWSKTHDTFKSENDIDYIYVNNRIDKIMYIANKLGLSRAQAGKYNMLTKAPNELINRFMNKELTLNQICKIITN